ncbi:MAG: hypothetical protein JO047_10740 [Alphaproteobacteria bacterium]|nr:hypothetical protein [Alphaproteobacteria bacterium]
MAADVVVTTPAVPAPPAVVVPSAPAVVAPAPGVVVTPGATDAERHLDKAARAQERANEAAAEGNYGIAADQQEKADRNLDKADRDSTGTVTVIPR